MPKDNISWLTPRRRRTTGNLKHVPNGQVAINATAGGVSGDAPISPTIDEIPVERPASTQRTISSPVAPMINESGNLFYAYARKVPRCRSECADLHYCTEMM
jgi:hypothetical protein